MIKRISLTALAVAVVAGTAFACDVAKCSKPVADNASGSATMRLVAGKTSPCGGDTAGHIEKVMAGLPKMTYVAGDLQTPCHTTALAKAGCESKLQYMVGDEVYGCKTAATVALAEALEREANRMMSVRYAVGDQCMGCPRAAGAIASAKGVPVRYRLASVDFNSHEEAERAASACRAAIAGKANCPSTCDKTAKTAASKADCTKTCDKTAKTVAGKADCTKTCDKTAKTVASKADCTKTCDKTAKTVASKADCTKTCDKTAKTVAGKTNCPSTCDKSQCPAARLASSDATPEQDPQARVDAARQKIRTIVETAAGTLSS